MTATDMTPRTSLAVRIRRYLSDHPLIPLVFLLLVLVVALQIKQPGVVWRATGLNDPWVSNTVKFAIPLAILAACQTLTMLTAGIDLSAGTVATISAFVMATQVPEHGPAVAILISLVPALLIGVANGIGVGLFNVHPLIMTLGMGLVGTGFLQVYQRTVIASGSVVPDFLAWLGTGVTKEIMGLALPIGLPNALLVFVPLAALIIALLRWTGFGRLLYALGENPEAARLSGVRAWQVLLALYVLSSLLAGIAGLLYVGLIKAPSLSLAEPLLLPSVAAAVIGGTSIFGGRGSYSGTIVGALIIQVLKTFLAVMKIPEGGRRIVFGLIILAVTAIYIRITEDT